MKTIKIMVDVLYIKDSYISNLDELRNLFANKLPAILDVMEKEAIYNEVRTLFYDDVLLRWLEKGADEDLAIAQKIKSIDKSLQPSEIVCRINEAIVGKRIEIDRHIENYLKLVGSFYRINSEQDEILFDYIIESSKPCMARLVLLFRVKCVKSEPEVFCFILKQDGKNIDTKRKNIGDFTEGETYELRFEVSIPADKNCSYFELVIEKDVLRTFRFIRK